MGSPQRFWNILFIKPGNRRKKRGSRPSTSYDRKLHVEQFEDRRMLATFMVTEFYDAVVNTSESVGTLRQAIEDAEINPGADIILFDASLNFDTITLGIDEFGNNLNFTSTQGELAITEAVTIDASANFSLTIDASGNDNDVNVDDGGGSRVFNINANSFSGLNREVVLNNLNLRGGDVTGDGGAVRFDSGSSTAANTDFKLTIIDSAMTGNYATGSGGGVSFETRNVDTSSNVKLTITDSSVTNNGAGGLPPLTGELGGGGVFANLLHNGDAAVEPGVLIERTFVANNNTAALIFPDADVEGGGGVFIRAIGFNTVISDSRIEDNTSDARGGGLFIRTNSLLGNRRGESRHHR